ncbi:MAG TPA: LysE family transporter [Bacteroidales bacterium]|jgi:threonine/homoserine/homoserine lactone efflux protein|nr:LysE family transporter [Bacteroidales bacterium]
MIESILTISITALIAGFIFAMPIAGPISVLIVSNSLGGKYRYSKMVAVGASSCEILYIFIAIFGVTRLYSYYKPVIPYLFLIGAVFFFILALKLFKKPFDLESIKEEAHLPERIRMKQNRGFYTGFMVNLLNPTLFLSGLISSFFVISFVSALGFNTGGLAGRIDRNVKEISSVEAQRIEENLSSEKFKKIEGIKIRKNGKETQESNRIQILLCVLYAVFISLGGVTWFFLLVWIIEKYRKLINIKVMSGLIKGFAVILFILAFFFAYSGVKEIL